MSQEAKPAPVMASEAWEDALTASLAAAFPDANIVFARYRGQEFLQVAAAQVPALIAYLREREGFRYFTDLTIVDHPKDAERFEVVIHLYSLDNARRIRVKSRAGEHDDFPTLSGIFPAANWLEREAFDMFGLRFAGHPNLKRILMPEDWEGFPLRKEKSILAMDNDWVAKHLGIESGQ